jgi:hypothetical protein
VTCIAAIAHEGKVYIGGERAAADEVSIVPLSVPKVNVKGDWIYGYAGTYGIGQLMDLIKLPPAGDNPYLTLRTVVVDKLKDTISKYSRENDKESETVWLIGAGGRLFELHHSDYSTIEVSTTAIGSGANLALGSLYTTSDWKNQEKRLKTAIEAAITYSPTCQGPIDIFSL